MKAVIPAAGKGTRWNRATRAVPKVMLPLIDRPLIEYAVDEAAAAGITEVVIVVGGGQETIRRHFEGDHGLGVEIEYVVQDEPLGLGHAVATAAGVLGGEPFAVLLPDEVIDPECLSALCDVADERAASAIGLMEVPPEEVSAYGVPDAEPVDGADGLVLVRSIVEKPPAAEAPSTFATIGRYVFTPEILDVLEQVEPGHGGEIQLTDAIDLLARKQPVYGITEGCDRWDVGNALAMMKASIDHALARDDLRDDLRAFLRGLDLA